ncbi:MULTISPECIES: hypothetical protein [unclassified Rathayibacter]|uniref:hypothetical protein n=1 Tax=unclassified Rathayibacter TaxID=2609250 RepID=UPI000CE75662|nr:MULTISPECIES: hypothetical protein [unclassified Rathayibacter]PPF26307.1 hypothetical protein C5C54_13765 [Rathayibacter sp. AY1F2]PPH42447.1 hypothetical protein C5C42_15320 [Rathayibacter sp. AY1F7]
MSRPVVVTRLRAGIFLVLIALAGRRLLWPLVVALFLLFTWITWPLIPIALGVTVLLGVLAFILELLG